jgi:hypothetical protein
MLYLGKSQKLNSWEILSTLRTKLTKRFSTARILQLSMRFQVQENCHFNRIHCTKKAHWFSHIWIQPELSRDRIKVHYLETEDVAGACTKNLPSPSFQKFKKKTWSDIFKGNLAYHFFVSARLNVLYCRVGSRESIFNKFRVKIVCARASLQFWL